MADILSMRNLAGTMLDLRSVLSGAVGKTFGGIRDVSKALGYKPDLGPEDYRKRYERNEIAGRIVDALPSATWRGSGELIEDEDPTVVTEFESSWFELDHRLKVWSIFKRADILSGLGRYSVVLIGAPGELNTPLTKVSAEQVVYLTPFAETDCSVAEYDTDYQSSRFGLPVLYQLKRVDMSQTNRKKHVHWSRCVHVADGLLDDHIFALPKLQRIWNRLDDLDKVVGGGSEAFWMKANPGMQLDLDPAIKIEPGSVGDQKMIDEVSEYEHGLRRTLRTKGVKITQLDSTVADFSSQVASILGLISGATGLPQRILLGSERGELASSQDRLNWQEKVNDRRAEFADPYIVRQFVDRLIEFGALPEPVEYAVRWPAGEMSEEMRADLALKYADVNARNQATVITEDEIRDRALGWAPLEDVVDEDDDQIIVEDEDGKEEGDGRAEEGPEGGRQRQRENQALVTSARRKVGTMSDKRRTWWRHYKRRAKEKAVA